jgi:hypothetical protein
MTNSETLNTALKSLGYPVFRIIYKGGKSKTPPSIYFTFQTILTQSRVFADDERENSIQTFRVNLFSKTDFTDVLKNTIEALEESGFVISTVDAEDYDEDTGYYLVPITIKKMEE